MNLLGYSTSKLLKRKLRALPVDAGNLKKVFLLDEDRVAARTSIEDTSYDSAGQQT